MHLGLYCSTLQCSQLRNIFQAALVQRSGTTVAVVMLGTSPPYCTTFQGQPPCRTAKNPLSHPAALEAKHVTFTRSFSENCEINLF